MLREIFDCFAISTHRYMHFLPAMKATHPFFFLRDACSSSPSAVITNIVKGTNHCQRAGQSYNCYEKCQGDEQVVKVPAKVITINTEFDECH